ncbi:MAG: glycoside hydrolase family 2 protein [Rikenellaceae bacterium]|jgi:beta-galactosidase|nr:glycoside hydrolase family 2 protein [Rikenellaceae bacterium]
MKRIVLFVMLLLWGPAPGLARQVVNLNQRWQFTQGNDLGRRDRREVNLPHTWDTAPLPSGEEHTSLTGNYIKDVAIPAVWRGQRIFIRFHGVSGEALLFVNGRFAGEHQGGYAAFTFELTDLVRYGEQNNLWVRVNNSRGFDYLPLTGDFNTYGGIPRDIEMIVVPPVHIALTDYSSDGIYLAPKKVTDENAAVTATVKLSGKSTASYTVSVEVRSADNVHTAESASAKAKPENGSATVNLALNITQPVLWNGRKNPYRYNFHVKVSDEKGLGVDSLVVPMGLRYYAIDPLRGFMLNGKPYRLHGITMSEDRAGAGNALRPTYRDEDFSILREIGANAVRMAGYPHDPSFYEQCDREGIVLWSEIPLTGSITSRTNAYIEKPSVRESGKQQLTEMILQNFNHTSVFFWGLFSNLPTSGGDSPVPYIKELNDAAHRLDPSRMTVGTSNRDGDINFVTDLIGWSQYLGWEEGQVSDVGVWLDQLFYNWYNLRSGIGEYGAGGSIFQQDDALQRPAPRSNWHPERWQTHYHEQFYAIANRYPALWGTFVHTLFDFGSAGYPGGDSPGVSNLGLVTYDRRDRKDAFYFYKANWNLDDPFVHIAEKRWNRRSASIQTIRVYSNLSSVELVVNGESLGERQGVNGVFVWKDIPMKKGKNNVSAFSGTLSDQTVVGIQQPQQTE